MSELAVQGSIGNTYFSCILRLDFLSPDVATAIMRDHHPLELTAKHLAHDVRLPVDWQWQRTLLGTE